MEKQGWQKQAWQKVRILAYIDKFDPPDDEDHGAIKWLVRECVKGFWLDVTVEMEGGDEYFVLEHCGDGKVYPTLEEAEGVVLEQFGLKLERIPEHTNGTPWTCAAYLIAEFERTNKPGSVVAAESPITRRNADHSRRVERAPTS